MLRRIKAQVSQVVDEAKTSDLPGNDTIFKLKTKEMKLKLNSNANSTNREVQNTQSVDDEEIEGLICPMCMAKFTTTDQLTSHFESAHTETSSGVTNPNFAGSDTSSPSYSSSAPTTAFATKDQEIEELRTQIREEKRFSERLKEELHNIQSVIAQASDVPEGEVPYLMQQIQVLTADKGMVIKQFLEIEKESGQQKRQLDQVQGERNELMTKLKQMSGQLRELTDENEAVKIEKEQRQRSLQVANSDIKKYEVEVARLEKMLDMRPSEDDVNVLRTELVNAQKLMDDISQEKDVEMKEQISAIRNLSIEREKQHLMLETLQKRLAEHEQGAKGSSEEVVNLTLQLSELQEHLKESNKTNEVLVAEAKSKDDRLVELQKRIDENIVELTKCRENVTILEEKVKTSESAISNAKSTNDTNEGKLQTLQEKLETLIEEKRRFESEICGFEEKSVKNVENLKSLEMANSDLTNELSSIGSLLDHERSLLAQKNIEISQRDETIRLLKDQLAETENKATKWNDELKERAELVENLTAQINKLQENSKDLLNKITEGEGGANMAIQQLNQEKEKLTSELVSAGEKIKKLTEDFGTKINDLEKKARTEEGTRAEKEQQWKEEKEGFVRRLKESEDEIKRKAERFVEMEKEMDEERQKSLDRTAKVKELIVQKEKGMEELRKQNIELTESINEREKNVREKDVHLEENRKRIEDAIKKLEEAEKRARELESTVSNRDSVVVTKETELEEMKSKLSESEAFIEQLKVQVEKVSGEMKEKEGEIETLVIELKEKETHWKTKRDEFEQQILRNQDENEESATNLKSIQECLTKEKELTNELKNHSSQLESQLNELKTEMEKGQLSEEEKTAELDKLKTQLTEISAEKVELAKSVETLRSERDNYHVKVEKLEEDMKELENRSAETIARIEQEKIELEHIGERKTLVVHQLEEKVVNQDNSISSLNDNLRVLEEDLDSKISVIETFNSRIEEFEKEMASSKRAIEQLESEKAGESEKLVKISMEHAEMQKNSEESINKRGKEVEEIKRDLDEKLKLIEKMKVKHSQFESMFEDVQETLQKEVQKKTEEIESLYEKLGKIEEESVLKIDELEKKITAKDRIIDSLETDLKQEKENSKEVQKNIEVMNKKFEDIKSQNNTWQEEKDALLERCLNGESDLDFERERAMENKRRFDESLSAMHELGRANQSLQMDMDRFTNRKWLDDSAAINCTDCGKLFSLTIRKHHCRVCGLIYCGQCSSKAVRIPSSKNPVRACNHCYTENENR